MNIVRIWLYGVTHEDIKLPECKPSPTNKVVTKEVRGDFVYYDIEGGVPNKVTRRDADKWALETGNIVETLRGYPTWMYDMGYRA
jgi:hypothetical protein